MKKDVLLCFDAFGTLFKPRIPVYKQYAETARKYGLSGFTDDDIAVSFKTAYAEEAKDNPNYGMATGMGAEKWYTNVIERTFAPWYPVQDKKLPSALAPALHHRFSTKEGYDMFPDAIRLFKRFADNRPAQTFRRVDHFEQGMPDRRLVVGVITNTDDRVPAVLSSFGLKVKPLRHGEDPRPFHPTNEPVDIDFSIMSYDVGHEKPDRRMFDAASGMLTEMLQAEGHKDADLSTWQKIFVGDDLEKDAIGAANAGWTGIWINRAHDSSNPDGPGDTPGMAPSQVIDHGVQSIEDLMSVASIIDHSE